MAGKEVLFPVVCAAEEGIVRILWNYISVVYRATESARKL